MPIPHEIPRHGKVFLSDEVYELRPGYFVDPSITRLGAMRRGLPLRMVSGFGWQDQSVIGQHWIREQDAEWAAIVLTEDPDTPWGVPRKYLRRIE